jgi:signal transduction histidine kinase
VSCASASILGMHKLSQLTLHECIRRRGRQTARTNLSSFLLAVPALLLVHLALAAEAKHVLVVHTSNRLSEYGIAVESGLRQVLDANPAQPVEIFSEFLDEPRFGGDRYELTVTTYLHDKYADHPLDAVVAGGDAALDFILRHRDQLFPRIPVLHLGVTPLALQSMPPLPPDVVGVPMVWDFAGTVKLALKWHPRATHLVIVTGASIQDDWESVINPQIAPILGHVQAEYLIGLPPAALQKRLRELGSDSVVLTMGFHRDRDGRFYLPGDAIALIVEASAAPVYSAAGVALGSGVVGGRMLSYEGTGRQYGEILEHLFSGQPDWQRMPDSNPSALQVDWRQLKRWGIDPELIPPDAVVSFRSPTLWQAYRNVVVGAVTVILLLSGLVVSLLLERRRRRTAEIAVQKQHTELAHASRLAVAGELTAAIAHELNQPLGAVQTNADAAELILQAGGDRREELLRIVARVQNDTLRASQVIKRLRTLLARHEARREPLDLKVALADVEVFLRPELKRRDIALALRLSATPARVLGDETQIQQVLINLIMNAMDASADASPDRRTIVVQLEFAAGAYSILVKDQGSGFADGDVSKLFDSFFSTKRTGMGLGLSIARTIVEAHGGTIEAENAPGGGAVFRVHLPAYNAA